MTTENVCRCRSAVSCPGPTGGRRLGALERFPACPATVPGILAELRANTDCSPNLMSEIACQSGLLTHLLTLQLGCAVAVATPFAHEGIIPPLSSQLSADSLLCRMNVNHSLEDRTLPRGTVIFSARDIHCGAQVLAQTYNRYKFVMRKEPLSQAHAQTFTVHRLSSFTQTQACAILCNAVRCSATYST